MRIKNEKNCHECTAMEIYAFLIQLFAFHYNVIVVDFTCLHLKFTYVHQGVLCTLGSSFCFNSSWYVSFLYNFLFFFVINL